MQWRRRAAQLWVPAFYALALAWIYRGLWHQGAPSGLGWDTIDTHGPDLDFFARDLAEGRFSLWNPYDKGGYPVFCDPVFDRYYPFNWPFAAWGAVFGTGWWLVQIKVLAHHVAAATCMHAFLRTRGLSLRAAMIGGLGLVASAPLLVHKASNVLWPLVWVPLVWIAIDAALAKPSWRRGVAVAAAFTLSATAGSPPGLFYALLLVAPYAIWRAAPVVRAAWHARRAQLVPLAICAGAAAGVAALVLVATVLPTRDLVALGSRDRFATGPTFALVGSLPFGAALRGVAVRGAGLFEMYMGSAVVLLAICGAVLRPRFDRRASLVFVAVALVGVILAAGETGGVLPWLVEHVPGFALLRVPGRYKLVSAWALAAAAGYGAGALEAAPDRRRLVATCVVAVVVVVVVVLVFGDPASPKDRAPGWSIVATALAAGAVAATLRWRDPALGVLALLALSDAPVFTFVSPGAPPAAELRQLHDRDAALVARMPGIREHYRIYDEFVLGERAGARLRVRDFRGYPAIDPLSLHRYVDVLDFAKRAPRIVTDFNVRYVLKAPHFRYGDATSFVAMPDPAFDFRGDGIWEAKHPAPLVQWVGAIELVTDPKLVLPAVRAIEEPDGARRRAIVEDATIPSGGEPDAREGTLERYEPDAIDIAIDAPRDGLVVLDEIMFPGWQVAVDGEPAEPVRANYLMRAVYVRAGHHAIAWRFAPAHWRVLVGGYVAALAIMLAAAAIPRRRSA